MRNRHLTIAALALILMTACGDDVGTGVEPDDLAGTWTATSMLFTQTAAPNATADAVVDLGAALTLVLAADGSYTFTFVLAPDPDENETGTFTVDGSTLTTTPTGETAETFTIARDGDTMTLAHNSHNDRGGGARLPLRALLGAIIHHSRRVLTVVLVFQVSLVSRKEHTAPGRPSRNEAVRPPLGAPSTPSFSHSIDCRGICALAAFDAQRYSSRGLLNERKATMRNRRLTIFAVAIMVMAGCGEDRGLNPELVNLVGSWSVQSFVFTSVATPGLTEEALSVAGGVDELTLYMYDDGTLLTITFFLDPVVDPTYDLETFDVFAAGDAIAGTETDIIADVEAACGAAATPSGNDVLSPCLVILFNEGESDQVAYTFTRNGDDMTINGTDMYDFGTGDEAATFVLDMDRFVLDNDRGPLIP